MRLLKLSAQVLIAVLLVFAVAAGMAEAATKKKKPEKKQALDPPMVVAIVRSGVPGCEPNCPQWISAEGAINAGSPALFKKILKQSGKARLPVIISSPGGDVDAALAIGEMIRARKLDVAVGWTYFSGCTPRDRKCKLPKENKGIYRGVPLTTQAFCFSACPFVLAAGQKRLSGDTLVGVHQISRTVTSQRVFYEERYRIVNGKKRVLSRKVVKRSPVKSYTTTKLDNSLQKKLSKYIGKMGIDQSFLALFAKAPPSSIHVLAATEAISTKLITEPSSAAALVDNKLCAATPAADNCVIAPAVKP